MNHLQIKTYAYDQDSIYIGETTNLKTRLLQHLKNQEKQKFHFTAVKVIFDDIFNKSVALDLESFLIQYYSGDGKYKVINKNDGLCDRDYYRRDEYRELFGNIWEQLRKLNLADQSLADINNSELFKFSPYKNLNTEQLNVVREIVENIDEALNINDKSLSIIDGDAGTGKTIVLMYLAKLLSDLESFNRDSTEVSENSNFPEFFEISTINERFSKLKIAIVIPQTSLRHRVEKIFEKVDMGQTFFKVMSPIAFGKSKDNFDIALVDEAHLLTVGFTGNTGKDYYEINRQLFGDQEIHTQLDWIMKKSRNVVLVYSSQQRIRPANITNDDVDKYNAQFIRRDYYLNTQMRSYGGKRYIDYIEEIFSDNPPPNREVFHNFEVKLFDKIDDFVAAVKQKDFEVGLSRIVAGFAWKWVSKKQKNTDDIDGYKLKWNTTDHNWVGSPNAVNEVGCIYTIQGEDLNYVGVIIGNDLQYRNGKLVFNPDGYADARARSRSMRQTKENVKLSEDDLLNQILRVYKILLNRAIKGVYVYVCDPELREYLSLFF